MVVVDAQLTGEQVLAAYRQDAPFLFMGAAFMTTGIVALALCTLRRRWIALLAWMGIFAFLYGLRMWLRATFVVLGPDGVLLAHRITPALSLLVPVPGFLFFKHAGFLGRDEKVSTGLRLILAAFVAMSAATLLLGSRALYGQIDTVLVSIMLTIMLARSLRNREGDSDFKVVRTGVLFFLITALWDNGMGQLRPSKAEPYGFAILLATLGYVAARQTLQRDVELGEIQKELDVARKIQLSILPAAFPASEDFCVAARYVPMTSVAGDLYDFVAAGPRQLGLFIADVSGHGVPAALIASMVKMAATSQRMHADHPARLLTGMNAALCGNTQGQYVTAACVYLDAAASELRYAAAGHPAMLLLRDGAVTEVVENGLLLAATESETYSEKRMSLMPRDRLLLYTDGLVEARDSDGELFGDERLIAAFRDTAHLPVAEAADRLIAAAQQWADVQDDDLTVLVCDFLPAQLR
jgi:sigma-B regulation protein RsbU (phosphoserine phosphatase)